MRRLVLIAPLALAGCVAPPPATAPAPPPPVAAPPPPALPPVAWEDGPATPGDWRWRRDAQGSVATFGVAGQEPALAVRCDPAQRTIALSVAGTATPGATLTIQTTDGARSYPAAGIAATPPGVGPRTAAVTAATDPFLDRMAYSRGRFRVRLGGAAPMVIPAWPEFARTVEDCRP